MKVRMGQKFVSLLLAAAMIIQPAYGAETEGPSTQETTAQATETQQPQTEASGFGSVIQGDPITETAAPETKASETNTAENNRETTSAGEEETAPVAQKTESTPNQTGAPARSEGIVKETEEQGETESLAVKGISADNDADRKAQAQKGETPDPYISVTLYGEGLKEGEKASVAVLKGDSLAKTTEGLTKYLAESNLEADWMMLPLELSLKSGGAKVQAGKLSVKISLTEAPALNDTSLYHLRDDGKWEQLPFVIENENGDDLPYILFETKSLSPFLFVTTKEGEPEKAKETESGKVETESAKHENESESELKTADTYDLQERAKEIGKTITGSGEESVTKETEHLSSTKSGFETETDSREDSGFETEAESETETETETETESETYRVVIPVTGKYEASFKDGTDTYSPGEKVTVTLTPTPGAEITNVSAVKIDSSDEEKVEFIGDYSKEALEKDVPSVIDDVVDTKGTVKTTGEANGASPVTVSFRMAKAPVALLAKTVVRGVASRATARVIYNPRSDHQGFTTATLRITSGAYSGNDIIARYCTSGHAFMNPQPGQSGSLNINTTEVINTATGKSSTSYTFDWYNYNGSYQNLHGYGSWEKNKPVHVRFHKVNSQTGQYTGSVNGTRYMVYETKTQADRINSILSQGKAPTADQFKKDRIETVTINAASVNSTGKYEVGKKYYAVETQAANGYERSTNVTAFEFSGANVDVNLSDRPSERPVSIYKKSTDSSGTGGLSEYRLAGATFTLTNQAQPSVAYTFVCGDDGKSGSQNVKVGTYTVHEAGTPPGYYQAQDFAVNIGLDGANIGVQVVEVNEQPKMGKVQIQKSAVSKDFANGNPNYSLAGAVFRLSRNGKSYDITVGSDEKSPVTEVLYGTYHVTEIKNPPGYTVNASIPDVTVSPSQNGSVQIIRPTDREIRPKLRIVKKSSIPDMTRNNQFYSFEGAKFRLEGYGRTFTFTCNAKGVSDTQEVPIGTYKVTELTVPKGFKKNTNIPACVVKDTEGLQTFEITDEPITGTVSVLAKKIVDNEFAPYYGKMPMAGAQFSVKYFSKTGVTDSDTPTRSWTIKTLSEIDENNKNQYVARLDSAHLAGSGLPLYGDNILPLGTVWIQEVKPPNHFYVNPSVYKIEVTQDGEGVTYKQGTDNGNLVEVGHKMTEEAAKVYEKYWVRAPLKITKKDSITKNPVKGVTFLLSGVSKYAGDVMVSSESTEDGTIDFGLVDYGTYTLQETGAPPEYIIDKNAYTVTVDILGNVKITKDGQEIAQAAGKNGEYVFENEPYHQVYFRKLSTYGTGISVEGAEFRLTGTSDYKNELDLQAKSGDDGYTLFEKVEPGDYTLAETAAPTGYELNKTVYQVRVNKDGTFTINGLKQTEESFGTDQVKVKVYDYLDKPTGGEIELTKVWNDGKTASERPKPEQVTMSVSTKMPSKSVYGYGLEYNANGGQFSDGTTSNTVYYSGKIIAKGAYKVPSRYGYHLVGWKDANGNAYALDGANNSVSAVDTDRTIYANWEANEYTLTINGSASKHRYGEYVTFSIPSRSGYNFTGWTKSGAGTLNDNTHFTMGIGDATLTPNWTCAHPSSHAVYLSSSGWSDNGGNHKRTNYYHNVCNVCGAVTSGTYGADEYGGHYDNDNNGFCDVCGHDGRRFVTFILHYKTSSTAKAKTANETCIFNTYTNQWIQRTSNLAMGSHYQYFTGNWPDKGGRPTGIARAKHLCDYYPNGGTFYKKDYSGVKNNPYGNNYK